MKTQTTTATATTVAAPYTGPLGRYIKTQAEKVAAAEAEASKQATVRAMRYNVTELVADPQLFTDAERLRTNDSVFQCECVAQLQRWFQNVYRVYTERASALRLPFADGSTLFMAVAA